ncbi:MAG: FHA domain-containing protein, partial [Planctomycetaceae bacterium]
MAVLKVIRGSCPGQVFELPGERTVLGRLPTCQVVLDNGAVSRTHAQILESHGAYYLEDLRSRNGTLLNGESVEGRGRVELHPHDRIGVCEVELEFLPGGAASDPPVDYAPAGSLRATTAGEFPRDANPPAPPPRKPPELSEVGDSSSILSSIEVKSSQFPRVHVRPEAKLRAILEIGENLAGTLKIDVVLPRILESLFKIFPQSDRGVVVLKDQATDGFQIKAFRLRHEGTELDTARISTTILREAIDKSKAILSNDALRDPRFLTESVSNLRIRSFMCAPLPCQSGGVQGAIQLDTFNLGSPFSQEDLDVLVSLSAQAALALDNIHLHESAL